MGKRTKTDESSTHVEAEMRVAIEAGSIMHARLRELAARQCQFAFETTLASRSLAPSLTDLIRSGFEFHLVYFWLPSADFAVQRVADRVRMGGHNVPEATVRRRYTRGLRNFFRLYQPLATTWAMYDNSEPKGMRLIAHGQRTRVSDVPRPQIWQTLQQEYGHDE